MDADLFKAAEEAAYPVSKEDYKTQVPLLRQALLDVQYRALDKAEFPVIIIVGGMDGGGRSETANLFNEWMDPRHIITHGFGRPTDEEAQRPPMWRFWRVLPPKGQIGMFIGSWYSSPIARRINGDINTKTLDKYTTIIQRFENMLITESALLVKFWFHLSKSAQKQRLKNLESDPKTRWRITDADWAQYHDYDKYREVSACVVNATSSLQAPWHVIDGSDDRYRTLSAGNILLNALQERLSASPADKVVIQPLSPPAPDVLRELDYTPQIGGKEYESQLETWQGRLNQLVRDKHFQKKSLVIAFEGQDAAGKGGCIRRITAALDARQYRVIPIAAPSDEERAQPYLWRFWRRLPLRGHIVLFDRTWYGRVLVERVEKFTSVPDWQRAYEEINDFESQMASHDVIVVKFWLAITKDKQLERFHEREQVSFKNYKITPEDWRNREKWDDYDVAINDMLARTNTDIAPWTVISANDEEYARIEVLKTLCRRIEEALEKN